MFKTYLQNTFDRVNVQDKPRNRKCLSPDNSQNIAHINNKNYSPVHVTSKITGLYHCSIISIHYNIVL